VGKLGGPRTRHLIAVRDGYWYAVIGGVAIPTHYPTGRFTFEQARREVSRLNPNLALRFVDASGGGAGDTTRCPRCRYPLSPAKYCRSCKHGWDFGASEEPSKSSANSENS